MAAIIGIFILPIVLLARHKNLTGIDTQTINTKHSINTTVLIVVYVSWQPFFILKWPPIRSYSLYITTCKQCIKVKTMGMHIFASLGI